MLSPPAPVGGQSTGVLNFSVHPVDCLTREPEEVLKKGRIFWCVSGAIVGCRGDGLSIVFLIDCWHLAGIVLNVDGKEFIYMFLIKVDCFWSFL